MSPPVDEPPAPSPALRVRIEQRARRRAARRRTAVAALTVGGAAAVIMALVLKGGWIASPQASTRGAANEGPHVGIEGPRAEGPRAGIEAPREAVEVHSGERIVVPPSETSTVFELRPGIGTVLAKPGAEFTYDTTRRVLSLHRGEIVANITPSGKGCRIATDVVAVQVAGALFTIEATTRDVRVWHGKVQLLDSQAEDGTAREIAGDERYEDLPSEDARMLQFTIPTLPPASARPASVRPASEPPTSVTPPVRSALGAPPRPSQEPSTTRPAQRRELEAPVEPNLDRGLLLDAQARLAAGAPSRALELLREHELHYPSSLLAEERALLALRARMQMNDRDALVREIGAFLANFPSSSHAVEVQELKREVDGRRSVAPPSR